MSKKVKSEEPSVAGKDNTIQSASKVRQKTRSVISNEEKAKRASVLVFARAEKAKCAAELVIANAEKAIRAAGLVIANLEIEKHADEVIITGKEKTYQNEDRIKSATESFISDVNNTKHEAELVIANIEKANRRVKSIIADRELHFQTGEKSKPEIWSVIAEAEKTKREIERVIANIRKANQSAKLVIANVEKAKLAAESVIANKELFYQKSEKSKRAAELIIAKVKKSKRAAELIIANIEKAKLAAEFVIANRELLLVKEKEKLVKELTVVNKELILQIHERKLAEEALQHISVFSESLLKTIPFGMHIVDETGTVLFQSDNLKKIFGESAIGLKCWELYRDDKKQCIDCPLIKGITVGETEAYEAHGVFGNRIFDIIHTGMIYQGRKAMLEIFQDITENKKAEGKLKESENKYRNLVENSPDAIIIHQDNVIVFANKQSIRLVGAERLEDLNERSLIEFVHPDYRALAIGRIGKLQKTGDIVPPTEERFIRFDGKEIDVEVTGMAIVYDHKPAIQLIIHDISGRKQAEKDVREATAKFLSLAQNISGYIAYVNAVTLKYEFVNEMYEKAFGIPKEKITGSDVKAIIGDTNYQFALEYINKVKSGQPCSYENEFDLATGKRWLQVNYSPIFDSGGNVKSFAVLNYDITDRKRSEMELLRAKEQAEESERLKTAFLTNMSHEIRTPMNGILGFAELLKEPNLTSDEQQDYIHTIQISGARMLYTINNIVDLSKIESGLVKVDIEETSINEKIEFIYKFFKPEAEIKGLLFLVKKGLPDDEAIIYTDNEKVYAILINLVKNAIKFTYEGSIEIGYEKKVEYLEFFVKDTGIGIPKNQNEQIFKRFRQGSESHNRSYEGSGLGLSICKSYVEMLGGEIWVESEEGKGSEFYFTIPYNTVGGGKDSPENASFEKVKEDETKNLKILIVEDDEISHSLLSRMLNNISREILHAITGVESITTCQNNPDIDLVMMDIRMPEMDGYEATRQIRRFNKDVVIIAQTAYGFSGDKQKALAAGCNDYISKPINRTLMYELIKKHFNK
jgi:hypothetical protein